MLALLRSELTADGESIQEAPEGYYVSGWIPGRLMPSKCSFNRAWLFLWRRALQYLGTGFCGSISLFRNPQFSVQQRAFEPDHNVALLPNVWPNQYGLFHAMLLLYPSDHLVLSRHSQNGRYEARSFMAEILGCEIKEKIYESANSLVYRAFRTQDHQPVILKVLKEDYPSPEELTRYRQEYEITSSLEADGSIRVYGQQGYRNTLVMFLEDFGGQSLRMLLKQERLGVADFLEYAIKIVVALSEIHEHRIIHKDINPANIVINREKGILKIIDFGISTRLSRESKTFIDPKSLEGTLTHMSPEQTGRMNCPMDYRTDFYSLGVTFYEMLTGQLPYKTSHPLELVHDHLVAEPEPPHQIRPDVPPALSEITLCLMAKRPEDRYQSAIGLEADLRECSKQWHRQQQIHLAVLGLQDRFDHFEVPHRLYGREKELQILHECFDQIDQKGALMLVAGYSGIGKTALVQELYQPVTGRKGFFTAGKFDQFQRDVPYSALITAFGDLVRQLLTKEASELALWKKKLLTALGHNGQIIIDLIPELAHVIGVQAAVEEIGPVERRNRFNLTFLNFQQAFCHRDHPLVIFLDDLQWIDAASLDLVELMMSENSGNLLVIGAYRNNEVDGSHPLMLCRDRLEKRDVSLREITLGPLTADHLSHLIADTLRLDTTEVEDLVALISAKTDGNPFFVNQFLVTLYEENLLERVPGTARQTWTWDIDRIEALDMTDNVVDLVIGKLRKLPVSTQNALSLAACVGNRFGLDTLSTIHEKTPAETWQDLVPSVQEGLILPLTKLETLDDGLAKASLVHSSFRFLHDRVQEAAYSLIEASRKQEVHYRIGNLLLARIPKEEQEQRIFDLVDHLNIGLSLIDEESRPVLARLNLLAGRKTSNSNNYEKALIYLRQGVAVVPQDGWEEAYALMAALHMEIIRAEYLAGHFEEASGVVAQTLARVQTDMEKVDIHKLTAIQYTTMARYAEALEEGRKALSLMGERLPQTIEPALIEREKDEVEKNLVGRTVSQLVASREVSDDTIRATMAVFNELISPSFLSDPAQHLYIALKMTNLSLIHGHTPESSTGYAAYAIRLSGDYREYARAYDFGELSMRLSDRFANVSLICTIYFTHFTYLHHWRRPLSDSIDPLERSYQAGLEVGNLNWGGYSLGLKATHLYFSGTPLPGLLQKTFPDTLHFPAKEPGPSWLRYCRYRPLGCQTPDRSRSSPRILSIRRRVLM